MSASAFRLHPGAVTDHASSRGPSDMFIPQLSTPDPRARALVTYAACAIGMGVIYFLACHVALSIDVTDGAASVWPASGLLFGVLLLTPNRLVPPVLLGTLLGGIVANLGVGFDGGNQHRLQLHQSGRRLMGRWLVRRYWPDAPRLSHPLNLFALIACGAGAAVAGAVVAATLASVTRTQVGRRCSARGPALTPPVS